MIYNIGSTPIASLNLNNVEPYLLEVDFVTPWGLSGNQIGIETIIGWAESTELNINHLLLWSKVIGINSNQLLVWLKTAGIDNDIMLLWAKTFGTEHVNKLKWSRVQDFSNELNLVWDKVHWLDVIAKLLWEKTGSLSKEQIIPWGPVEELNFALEFNWGELKNIANDTEIPWVKTRELSVYNFTDWVPGELDIPKGMLEKDVNLPWLSVARIIMTEQNVSFKRVIDNEPVAIVNGSFGIDRDSWSWTFSGTIPSEEELDKIKPTPEGEIEVELSLNGYVVRFLIDDYKKNYQRAKGTYSVTGKSVSAILGSPYSPIETMIFEGVNADQIITTALQDTGWTFDWELTENPWFISGKKSFHDKTKIEIINEIAKSIGGMVQTDLSDKKIILKKKMPVNPVHFASTTPDEICLKEYTNLGCSSSAKAKYNNIIVSGYSGSYTVRRSGTSGTRSAPEILEPLLTTQNLCVERGAAELNEKGYDYLVYSLELPLPPFGSSNRPKLLLPGDLYQVTDRKETWTGVVVSNSIGWERGRTKQRIGVERPLLET